MSDGDLAAVSIARLVVSMTSRFPRIGRAQERSQRRPVKHLFYLFAVESSREPRKHAYSVRRNIAGNSYAAVFAVKADFALKLL
jgi:hypothetical protein